MFGRGFDSRRLHIYNVVKPAVIAGFVVLYSLVPPFTLTIDTTHLQCVPSPYFTTVLQLIYNHGESNTYFHI
jgi:hypothetical protein